MFKEFPEWNSLDASALDDLLNVFSLDSLKSSHPVSVPIEHPREISQIFDAISYDKGERDRTVGGGSSLAWTLHPIPLTNFFAMIFFHTSAATKQCISKEFVKKITTRSQLKVRYCDESSLCRVVSKRQIMVRWLKVPYHWFTCTLVGLHHTNIWKCKRRLYVCVFRSQTRKNYWTDCVDFCTEMMTLSE